ncbi:AAA family ATPase [Pseudomonas capsici]|uniref:ATP-binding protein n=1 Tax=Pseudomonas capsici TaxID=2810614 RepID=A0ABT3BS98_9PSED|nr:AAA family ATPase [Pseudomonas capsici]MCV4268051.1 ATP-binding protein [Pseudomonas capsici]MCV4276876.1 ATP-binding protein [Pseudomonas capsici]MCV4330427.1 ATP-binding protein [Pseudomonas capsici]MCV4375719.1 ATP-binding protein [Pseudomonas capsici]
MNHHTRVIYSSVAICVGGVPGAGKTTLLLNHVELEARDMQVTGSSIVKKIIAPSSVHELDGWSSEQRQAVREQSICELRQLQERCEGRLLVDGHFTLRNRVTGVLEPVFTPEDKAFFQALILIHPQPESVLAQRELDARARRAESIADVAAHIEFELHESRKLARDMGVPLLELVECDMPKRLHAMSEFLERVAPLEAR